MECFSEKVNAVLRQVKDVEQFTKTKKNYCC